MKRFCAFVLVILLLIPAIVSCSDNGGNVKDPTDTTARADDTTSSDVNGALTKEVEPLDKDIQALDYSGKTITILSRPGTSEWAKTEI